MRQIKSTRSGLDREHSHMCPRLKHRIHYCPQCQGCEFLDFVDDKGVSYEVHCDYPTDARVLTQFDPAKAVDQVNLPAYFGKDIFNIDSHSYLEPKRDGARCILHFVDGIIYATGRRRDSSGLMSEWSDNIPHIKHSGYPVEWEGMVLDGEIMCIPFAASATGNVPSGTLAATMSVVGAHPATAIATQKLQGYAHVYVFDIPFGPGNVDLRQQPLSYRRSILHGIMGELEAISSYLHMVEGRWCPDRQSRVDYFNECLAAGHEGCVAKNDSWYGSPYAWLKIKQKLALDCLVTGFEFGKPGGKYEHTVGTLCCSVYDENGDLRQVTKVVPGADNIRQSLFARFIAAESITGLGIIVEVEAQSWTKEGFLRHPRILRYRTDKSDISIVDFNTIERH